MDSVANPEGEAMVPHLPHDANSLAKCLYPPLHGLTVIIAGQICGVYMIRCLKEHHTGIGYSRGLHKD